MAPGNKIVSASGGPEGASIALKNNNAGSRVAHPPAWAIIMRLEQCISLLFPPSARTCVRRHPPSPPALLCTYHDVVALHLRFFLRQFFQLQTLAATAMLTLFHSHYVCGHIVYIHSDDSRAFSPPPVVRSPAGRRNVSGKKLRPCVLVGWTGEKGGCSKAVHYRSNGDQGGVGGGSGGGDEERTKGKRRRSPRSGALGRATDLYAPRARAPPLVGRPWRRDESAPAARLVVCNLRSAANFSHKSPESEPTAMRTQGCGTTHYKYPPPPVCVPGT